MLRVGTLVAFRGQVSFITVANLTLTVQGQSDFHNRICYISVLQMSNKRRLLFIYQLLV